MQESLGIVVPAYRPDVPALREYVRALHAACDPTTVRIELDAPRATVRDAIEGFSPPVEVNAVPTRRGKGAAIAAGFDALDADVFAFADADGSTSAPSVADVVRPVAAGAAAVSVGSRRHPESTILGHQTVVRRHLGDVFAWIARRALETRCRDYQCGAKAVDAGTWRRVASHLSETGFAWDLEFVAVAGALGYDVAEVPIVWEDHPASTVAPLSTTLELGRALVSVRRRAGALRRAASHPGAGRATESARFAPADDDE